MKGKALRKHSLHEKTAASVLLTVTRQFQYNQITDLFRTELTINLLELMLHPLVNPVLQEITFNSHFRVMLQEKHDDFKRLSSNSSCVSGLLSFQNYLCTSIHIVYLRSILQVSELSISVQYNVDQPRICTESLFARWH